MSTNLVTSPAAVAADSSQLPDPSRGLIAGLTLFTLGSMIAALGIAKLFSAAGARQDLALGLVALGAAVDVGCVAWLLQTLRRLPKACSDCERYGRHMIGLTFLLLVIGLCNAVGTSSLALDGGLGFSAATVLEASNPDHEVNAEKARQKAVDDVKAAERHTATAERTKARAEQELARACAPSLTENAGKSGCESARGQLVATEEALVASQGARADAREVLANAQAKCLTIRDNCKRALFFLLSLSTMMSLFGASFYVVNQVRSKRPRLIAESPTDATFAMLDPAAPESAATPPESVPTAPPTISAAQTGKGPTQQPRSEPFDVHAFWSGAFFRVGEAVLFTFAFFWLIWTSDRRTEVVWLPVLGLFVGMFVKTGEAIIFRLGMRVLSAVEALLPSSTPTPRGERPAASASEPTRGEAVTASGRTPEIAR